MAAKRRVSDFIEQNNIRLKNMGSDQYGLSLIFEAYVSAAHRDLKQAMFENNLEHKKSINLGEKRNFLSTSFFSFLFFVFYFVFCVLCFSQLNEVVHTDLLNYVIILKANGLDF